MLYVNGAVEKLRKGKKIENVTMAIGLILLPLLVINFYFSERLMVRRIILIVTCVSWLLASLYCRREKKKLARELSCYKKDLSEKDIRKLASAMGINANEIK